MCASCRSTRVPCTWVREADLMLRPTGGDPQHGTVLLASSGQPPGPKPLRHCVWNSMPGMPFHAGYHGQSGRHQNACQTGHGNSSCHAGAGHKHAQTLAELGQHSMGCPCKGQQAFPLSSAAHATLLNALVAAELFKLCAAQAPWQLLSTTDCVWPPCLATGCMLCQALKTKHRVRLSITCNVCAQPLTCSM